MDRLEAMPVGADHISDWTASDPVLQQVQTKVQHGWCDKCPSKGLAALLCDKRQTVSSQSGCILWGNCVVIPARGQQQLLENLHIAHPGIVRI